jgi:hypothetical protein
MSNFFQSNQWSCVTSELTGNRIHINGSRDSYLLVPNFSVPAVRKIAKEWVARAMALPSTNRPVAALRYNVESLIGVKTQDDATDLFERILSDYDSGKEVVSVATSQAAITQLLLALWSHGVLAFPLASTRPFDTLSVRSDNAGLSPEASAMLTDMENQLQNPNNVVDQRVRYRYAMGILLPRAGIKSIADITPTTFQYNDKEMLDPKPRPIVLSMMLTMIRKAYDVTWNPKSYGYFTVNSGQNKRDEDLNWATEKDPTVKPWADLILDYLNDEPANYKQKRSVGNKFLDYLIANPSITRDPMAFFDARNVPSPLLTELEPDMSRTLRRTLSTFLDAMLVRTCMDVDDYELPVMLPGFTNPMPKIRSKGANNAVTHRHPMPAYLVEQALRILTADDFAWAREDKKSYFRYNDPATGVTSMMWSPVKAIALIMKLELPARTFQVRFLDSGEGDTFRYEGDGKWLPNNGPHTPTIGLVERGVFRKYKREDGTTGAVFYFNTNKTADLSSKVPGYVMAWEHFGMLKRLAYLRDWQEQYNPQRKPTRWVDIAEHHKQIHKADLLARGENFFLFRNPCNDRNGNGQPVTDAVVRNFWLKLMVELERRLAAAGIAMKDGSPIKLIASYDKDGLPSAALYDLHSLRVTGITAMFKAGMPMEVIKLLVGHATIVMSAHYVKLTDAEVSSSVANSLEAYLATQRDESIAIVQLESRQNLEKLVAFNHHSVFSVLQDKITTNLVVMDHGICPVACQRCDEGLVASEPEDKIVRFVPVPGGASNCVRCRFFVSGPGFLLGLQAFINERLYVTKKESFEYENAQKEFDDLSDQFQAALDAGEPFANRRAIERAEARFNRATEGIDESLFSVHAAFNLIKQCQVILTDKQDSNGPALVAVGGIEQLESVLEETHEFEQLYTICRDAVIYSGLGLKWQQPAMERARLFDRMLRKSGIEPVLSLLSDEESLAIGNEMAKFLYARAGRRNTHDLMDGKTTLQALGLDKSFNESLQTMVPTMLRGKLVNIEAK